MVASNRYKSAWGLSASVPLSRAESGVAGFAPSSVLLDGDEEFSFALASL
jgi:hypothetical protein